VAAIFAPAAARGADPPQRLTSGRFTMVAYASDLPLARSLLDSALAHDSFPGLPRPTAPVTVAVAPDTRRFREWAGEGAPEWGAAIAIPAEWRVVMQGRSAGSDAGNPFSVLRHELAHLALHEYLDDLPPRWFDEGYASLCAREWGRDEVLAASVGLLLHGVPSLDSLDAGFTGGAMRASTAYALAYRAVADLAALDPERGLTLFFGYWRSTGSIDRAMREAYGLTESAFEIEWRRRTMQRYGALALTANLSLALAIMGILIGPFWLARRQRDRAKLDAMRRDEAAVERAEREGIIASLLGESPTDGPTSSAQRAPPGEHRERGGDST